MGTCTCTCMVSKNITITKEAYDFLKKMKTENKSFSQVILALKENRTNLMSYAGIFKDVDLSSVEKIRDNARNDWSKRK